MEMDNTEPLKFEGFTHPLSSPCLPYGSVSSRVQTRYGSTLIINASTFRDLFQKKRRNKTYFKTNRSVCSLYLCPFDVIHTLECIALCTACSTHLESLIISPSPI